MPRAYLYAIAITLGLLGLSSVALMLGFFALLLPGVLLLIAPTFALYMPFADAVFVTLRERRWLVALGAAGVWSIIFILTPLWTNARLDGETGRLMAGDFGRADSAPIGRLFLSAGPGQRGQAGVCGRLCARLLVRGDARAVIVPLARLETSRDLSRGYDGPAAVYALQPAALCKPLEGQLDPDRDVLAEIGAGACIVRQAADTAVFDSALISTAEDRGAGPRFNPFDRGIRRVERRAVWRCAADVCDQTLFKTSIDTHRLITPLFIGARYHGHTLRREVARGHVTANPATDHQVLGLDVGYAPARPSGFPLPSADPGQTRSVALRALIASARETRTLTEAEGVAVRAAVSSLHRAPGLTEQDYDLIAAIIEHPDIERGPDLSGLFSQHPEARERMATELVEAFDRLTANGRYEQARHRRAVAREISLLSPSGFARGQAVVLRAAARPYALEGSPELTARLGDYGEAALPLLTAALGSGSSSKTHVALGLCRLGSAAAPVANLLAASGRAGAPPPFPEPRAVALALARIGRRDLAAEPSYGFFPSSRDRQTREWYDGLATVTPASPASICTEKRLRGDR